MKGFKIFHLLAVLATLSAISVNGQITTPCTASMISSFTPCINFITGSTANGASPTRGCCDSLKSLMSSSMDCACLVIAANIPLRLPINRTLALSLPRACNMGGVPIQCKASGTPLPAPGPVLLGPTLAPMADSPFSPQASKASAFAPAPDSDTTMDLTPASPPLPTTTSSGGVRPVLTPPPSDSCHISPPAVLLSIVGMMIFNCHV
ncbi:hypothetical protein QYF36_010318 [Acer negundo]|nr:hypothetical protein QYF36_010318 [Acer negundo]